MEALIAEEMKNMGEQQEEEDPNDMSPSQSPNESDDDNFSSSGGLVTIRESSVGIDDEQDIYRPSTTIIGGKFLTLSEGEEEELAAQQEEELNANNEKPIENASNDTSSIQQHPEAAVASSEPEPIIQTPEAPAPQEELEDIIEEKLRDNEKYSIFFKMLRMGVPMPAVKNKMTQKGVNPQILDLGEEALMGKVLALERAFEAEQRLAKLPKKQGETIHWEAIPETRLVSRETVFMGADFELDKATLVHVQDLLELFKKVPVDPEAKDAENSGEKQTMRQAVTARMKKERVDSVLDGRRAQAISIAMKKLKIHPDHPAKFTWALREMNENIINSQAVEVLLSCPLWPVNDEEMSALKTKSEAGAKLAEPDKLILFVIETVPDVITRVNAMAFRWEF